MATVNMTVNGQKQEKLIDLAQIYPYGIKYSLDSITISDGYQYIGWFMNQEWDNEIFPTDNEEVEKYITQNIKDETSMSAILHGCVDYTAQNSKIETIYLVFKKK